MQPAPARPGTATQRRLVLRPGQRPRRGSREPRKRGRGRARAGPEVVAFPRDGTGRGGQGGHERPRPGPAPGEDAAVGIGSLVPPLPDRRRSRPPTPKLTSRCPGGSSDFSLASLLPASEEKTSCCGLTETRGPESRPGGAWCGTGPPELFCLVPTRGRSLESWLCLFQVIGEQSRLNLLLRLAPS